MKKSYEAPNVVITAFNTEDCTNGNIVLVRSTAGPNANNAGQYTRKVNTQTLR